MKEYKKYYNELIKMAPFAHINSEKDMEWLMSCLEGRIINYEGEKDSWNSEGYLFFRIPNTGKALKTKQKRAEKLCNYKCEFHARLIEYLESQN
ncbi:MAG TPA: hypothetical protein VFC96_03335 [Anaerovoracaceae bacterium]|nr:hypothetical protein [Anaerovoracaceae bacterium]